MIESRKKLGDMLVEAGLINESQRNAALEEQERWGGRLASTLIHMGYLDETSAAPVLEKQLGQQCISLKSKEIPFNILSMVKPDVAKKYNIVPLDLKKRTLSVAISNPNDLQTVDEISFVLGLNIKPVLALEYDIRNAINQYYH